MINEVIYTNRATEDKIFWQRTNPKQWKRIERLIENIIETPFLGLGKPEPLRFSKSGYWSRRIDSEHRLVYKVYKDTLYIVQCRYHYED